MATVFKLCERLFNNNLNESSQSADRSFNSTDVVLDLEKECLLYLIEFTIMYFLYGEWHVSYIR